MRSVIIYAVLITFGLVTSGTVLGQSGLAGTYYPNEIYTTNLGDTFTIIGHLVYTFKEDSSYFSICPVCKDERKTPGSWRINGDTLILNSAKQKTKEPIDRIIERFMPDTNILIIEVIDKDQKPVTMEFVDVFSPAGPGSMWFGFDGKVFFNLARADSIKFYRLEKFYNVPVIYKPKKPETNYFIVYLNVSQYDYKYDYKSDEKYLIKGDRLYPVEPPVISDEEHYKRGGIVDKSCIYFEKKTTSK